MSRMWPIKISRNARIVFSSGGAARSRCTASIFIHYPCPQSVSSGLHESDLRRQRSHFPNSRSSPFVPYLNFMRPVLIYRAVIRSRERHLVRVGMLFEERSEKLKAAAEKVGNSTAFRIEAVAVSDGPDPVSTAEGFCAAQRDGRMQAVLTGRPGGPVGSEVLSTAIGIPVIQLGCSQQHQGDEKQLFMQNLRCGSPQSWDLPLYNREDDPNRS
ncbi:hypothetical protein Bbelb_360130 [Branchiostoma belcheri]|nr:hypothetical protein Bbelb_360130 [Branchiostoma belcheri]